MKGLVSLSFIGVLFIFLILGCIQEDKITVESNNCDISHQDIKDNLILDSCKIHLHCENTTNIIIKNNIFECNGTIYITLNNSKEAFLFGNNITANLNIQDSMNIAIVQYHLPAPMSFRSKRNYLLDGEEGD